jgi:hypothetical protein
MTRHFQFQELTLYGADSHFTYGFQPGVNLILGPVGSGKTSLLELMKYALGGSAVLSPAVQEGVLAAAVKIDVGDESAVLLRQIGSTTVTAHSADGGALGTYSVVAGRSQPPISDLLLRLLDIPALRIPRSRRNPTGESSRLTFFDVYQYLYLSQTEIDRSVVSHLESYREPKRRATFELLYGLSNALLLDLEVQRGELREELANEQRRAEHIRAFLTAADQPDVDQLRRQRERAAASLESAQAKVRALRESVRSESQAADPSRQRLAELEALQDLDRSRLQAATVGIQGLQGLAAQLDLDLQRIVKSIAADKILSGLEFKLCPRCLRIVDATRVQDGTCYLCLQPEDVADLRSHLEDESRRVEQQRDETRELIAEDEREIAVLRDAIDSRAGEIASVRAAVDEGTANFVSPRFAEIEASAAEVGSLATLVTDLEKANRLWVQHGAIEARARAFSAQIVEVDSQIAAARAALSDGIERVRTLSSMFGETLEQFQLPWLETASVDLQTYLPVVNGRSFEELSSGGMKTLVNDAYHIAALRYALAYADSLLPLLQVIDSPRKNLGSGPEDRALSSNLYRRIRAIQDAFGRDFQMIVADNDAPEIARGYPTIGLSYQSPSVPFLHHPGPELVESIGGPSRQG